MHSASRSDVGRSDVSSSDDRAERGTVTAELAILMPAVALMLLAVLAAGSVSMAQLRCVDAARTGARLAARSEPAAAVGAAVRAEAPAGADVEVVSSGGAVTVRISAAVVLPLPGRPSLGVGAQSTARLEGSS